MSEVLVVDLILLTLVAFAGAAVIRMRSLFASTILAGIYSLLMALVWSNMHALDVAFTEAAVGAGISTILLLGAIVHTGRHAKDRPLKLHTPAFLICLVTGGMLAYGTLDMPKFGDPSAPIHHLRVPKLLGQNVGKVPSAPKRTQKAEHKTAHHDGEHAEESHAHAHPDDDFNGHVPNTVTSLLAAYRGYDTMFETTVIFVAGISLILMLRRREDEEAVDGSSEKGAQA